MYMNIIRKKIIMRLVLFVFVLIGGYNFSFLYADAKNDAEGYINEQNESRNIRDEKRAKLLKILNLSQVKKEINLRDVWKNTKDPRILEYFEDCLGIKNGDCFEAKMSANALAEMNVKESKEALRKCMEKYKAIRGYCAVLLAKNGEAEKYGPVIVEEKAYSLCRGYKELIPYVEKGLKDEDPDAKSMAINILIGAEGYNNNEALKKASLELLKSNSPLARFHAAGYVHHFMKEKAFPYLKEALKDYPSSRNNEDDRLYKKEDFIKLINEREADETK